MQNTNDLEVDHEMIGAAMGEANRLERALMGCQRIFESREDMDYAVDWVQQVLDGTDPSHVVTRKTDGTL